MYKLIRIETSGMKGLGKNTAFQFLNDTINYAQYLKTSSVKAIFGPNGSGKTSFITALDVYKKLCESDSYLLNESEVKTLHNLINKKSEKFSISLWFSVCDIKTTYHHEIVINNQTQKPYIEKEILSMVKGRTINDSEKTILSIESGNLIEYSDSVYFKDLDDFLLMNLKKLNQYRSAVSLFSDINFINDLKKLIPMDWKAAKPPFDSIFISLLSVAHFSSHISVYMDNSDRHYEVGESAYELIKLYMNEPLDNNPIFWKGNQIPIGLFSAFEKQIEKMTEFIKLYKPSLRGIEIDKRENGAEYKVRLIMKYDGYSIDSEYESTGIKNLINMFNALDNASRGRISFIDEMDANMSEVYLTKLCEYFVNYSKGQLCFTTHNTAPMKILKKVKRGIDFINGFSDCVTWKKTGNSNPANLYTDGMIVGIPFNIEDFNFCDVFTN